VETGGNERGREAAVGESSPPSSFSSSSPSDTSRNAPPRQLTCAGCFREVAMRLEEDEPAGTQNTAGFVQHRG